jgi:hypothetical protein
MVLQLSVSADALPHLIHFDFIHLSKYGVEGVGSLPLLPRIDYYSFSADGT